MLAVVYITLAARAGDTPLTDRGVSGAEIAEVSRQTGLPFDLVREAFARQAAEERFERDVNEATLRRLREVGLVALAALGGLSLLIGYLVAGQVLAPVSRITARARALAARSPDLSGRIGLGGPDDELRELADTLDDFLDRTEAAVSSQRRFLADASHELRTPLAAAQANVDVALTNPAADRAELRAAAEVAASQLRRMGRLVGDLLALERGASGRLDRVPVRAIVERAVAEVTTRAESAGVRISVAGPALVARGDPDDLHRAVLNLVENAVIHHHDRGGEVAITLEDRGARAAVIVTDDGPGIAAADQKRIFERFQRVDPHRRPGTGLGLAIVAELMRAGGGSARVESTPGAGATFTLELPAAR